jgi:GWxTD domain-containing protein
MIGCVKYVFYCFVLALSTVSLVAQSRVGGKGAFQVEIDMARFYGDASHSLTEVYYGVPTSMLAYKVDASGYSGAAHLRLEIWNDSAMLSMKEWDVPFKTSDTLKIASGQTLVGIEQLVLAEGAYRLKLKAKDIVDTTRIDTFTMPIRVASFGANKESFSDIELASQAQPSSDTSSMFYKNTLSVVPNASELYGEGLPFVYYYVEVYNLLNSSKKNDLTLKTSVTDGRFRVMYSSEKLKQRLNNSSVEVGKINVTSYPSGTYLLHLSLVDSSKHEYAAAEKKFFIYKPGKIDTGGVTATENDDFSTSEYAVMSEQEVDREYQYARYIVSDPDRKQYEHLKDVDAKRKFMFAFWQRHTAAAGMAPNEFKQEYLRRIQYANDNFTKGFKEGWKSDRGRVYVMYGPYDEVEQFASSSESNPYEIWHYNAIEGGVIFVFVDKNDIGVYVLVHSTHRDEIRNDNWYSQYAKKTY